MTYAPNNARARLERAMELVERAQNLLADAASELCPIVGLVPQWTATGKLHGQVKKFWYRLDKTLRSRGDGLKLDGNAQRFYDAKVAAGVPAAALGPVVPEQVRR